MVSVTTLLTLMLMMLVMIMTLMRALPTVQQLVEVTVQQVSFATSRGEKVGELGGAPLPDLELCLGDTGELLMPRVFLELEFVSCLQNGVERKRAESQYAGAHDAKLHAGVSTVCVKR